MPTQAYSRGLKPDQASRPQQSQQPFEYQDAASVEAPLPPALAGLAKASPSRCNTLTTSFVAGDLSNACCCLFLPYTQIRGSMRLPHDYSNLQEHLASCELTAFVTFSTSELG